MLVDSSTVEDVEETGGAVGIVMGVMEDVESKRIWRSILLDASPFAGLQRRRKASGYGGSSHGDGR